MHSNQHAQSNFAWALALGQIMLILNQVDDLTLAALAELLPRLLSSHPEPHPLRLHVPPAADLGSGSGTA